MRGLVASMGVVNKIVVVVMVRDGFDIFSLAWPVDKKKSDCEMHIKWSTLMGIHVKF